MKNILFVCSELYPLIKTGGLADFSFSYSRALSESANVIVLVPGYQIILDKLSGSKVIYEFDNSEHPTKIREATIPQSGVMLWIVDCPTLFDRAGSPYQDENDNEYADNAERFGHFCRVATDIALGKIDQPWTPDIVHCNDWHTGLIPAFLSLHPESPATVFTIHNLGYQGNFSGDTFDKLHIPLEWRNYEALEFHGQLSFIKGGIAFANIVTTVSPSYALDIQTEAFGWGLDGLLRHRGAQLRGILNGANYDVWNPETDKLITHNYTSDNLEDKVSNKLSIQKQNGLKKAKSYFLIGFIGRLAQQKGVDLLIKAIEANLDEKIQWVIVGKGDAHYENHLVSLAEQYPNQISIEIGYNEEVAHQVEASADALLMPSHYEPCGLNQIYSLKYGTVPIVSRTGGLKDSVINTDDESLKLGIATGFLFEPNNSDEMLHVISEATRRFRSKKTWQQLQRTGMEQDFSWSQSIHHYLDTYDEAIADKQHQSDQREALSDSQMVTHV